MQRTTLIALLLSIATWGVYAQVGDFGFAGLDDDIYVHGNYRLLDGVSGDDVVAAFGFERQTANWHPLTTLSLLFDAWLFGIDDPGPYHVVNALWHWLAVLLLFGALRAMTGREVESGFVAAAFALHPLHVESVAWISSRKDVIAGACWWGATWLHAIGVRDGSRAARRGALGVCALGLMAKPLLVTLPCTLLLFDLWPLRRRIDRAAVVEKLGFFALVIGASLVTWLVQSEGGAVAPLESITVADRLANAAVAYATYLGQVLWPTGLTFYYPHPTSVGQPGLSAAMVAGAIAILAGCTAVAIGAYRGGSRAPLVGWLFFLGVLVPMIGVVQVGNAAHADRYMYIPLVGLAMAVVYPLGDGLRRHYGSPARAPAVAAILSGVLVCAVWGVLAYQQTARWREAPTSFEHTLAHTTHNRLVHYNYGYWLQHHGNPEGAAHHFGRALEIDPRDAQSAVNLGLLTVLGGDQAGGIALIEQGLANDPDHVRGDLNLAVALVQRSGEGDLERADAHLATVLESDSREFLEDRTRAYRMRPELARLRGDPEAMVEFYEVSLAARPQDRDLVWMAVRRYLASGSPALYERARELADRLLRLEAGDPGDPGERSRDLAMRATAEELVGDREAALGTVREALSVPGEVAPELRERLLRAQERLAAQ